MPCTCCKRLKTGVPCGWFWKIAKDADIPLKEMMDVSMFDVRWMKLFAANYGCKDDAMRNLLYIAQQVRQ